MALSIPLVWTDAHRLHHPATGVWLGVSIPNDELPERADAVRDELVAAGAPVVEALPHDDEALLAVHDPGLVEFLRSGWNEWGEAGYHEDPGQEAVVGYIFPTSGFVAPVEPHVPTSRAARTGAFCFDTLTVVSRGTWEAARGALDVALTAADLVLGGDAPPTRAAGLPDTT